MLCLSFSLRIYSVLISNWLIFSTEFIYISSLPHRFCLFVVLFSLVLKLVMIFHGLLSIMALLYLFPFNLVPTSNYFIPLVFSSSFNNIFRPGHFIVHWETYGWISFELFARWTLVSHTERKTLVPSLFGRHWEVRSTHGWHI